MSKARSKSADSYLLKTDKEGAKALEIQHNFLAEYSFKQLKEAGLTPNQIVWDIGCGTGAMTEHIAKKVGPGGHVYALDASAEQLDHARKRLEESGLNNVTFIHTDITNPESLPQGKADLVYSRLLFMHLTKPLTVLKSIMGILKPGGVLVVQEAVRKSIKSSTPIPALDHFVKCSEQLGASKGVDYNIGEKIEHLIAEVGFRVLNTHIKSEKVGSEIASQVIEIRVSEMGERAIEAGIAKVDEVGQWYKLPTQMRAMGPDFSVMLGKIYSVTAVRDEGS